MTKVVSFKVSNEIYAKLKDTGKTFKEQLEPLIKDYFTEKPCIHQGIPKETTNYDYESICKWLDSIKEEKE